MYLFAGIAEGFALLALTNFTVVTSFYLASLVITNPLCAGIIWFRRVRVSASLS